jgi:hypothetical protein
MFFRGKMPENISNLFEQFSHEDMMIVSWYYILCFIEHSGIFLSYDE